MIDPITIATAFLLSPAANESLQSGPNPHDLKWTIEGKFRPVGEDTVYEAKADFGMWVDNRHHADYAMGTDTFNQRRPDFPLTVCCEGRPERPHKTPHGPPSTPPAVPLPASLWLITAALTTLLMFKRKAQ